MKLWKKVTALALAACLLVSGMTVSASAVAASSDFFAGASLNLNEGIAIQFFVMPDAVKNYDSTYLTVDYLDRDETTLTMTIEAEDYALEGTSLKRYLFNGVSPDRMDDKVTATLYGVKGGTATQLCEPFEYSVKQYVSNIYTRTTQVVNGDDTYLDDLALQTVLADILYYGEKARLYTGTNNTSLISDCSWVDTCKSDAVDMSDVSSVKNLTDFANAHVEWTSVGLNLRENPAILYKFKLTNKASGVSNYKLVVEVEDQEKFEYQLSAADYNKSERCYVYRFRGLNPTKMGETVAAYFVDANGNKVSATLDYSVESFAKFCYDETSGGTQTGDTVNTELYNLMQAVLAYGNSTKSYFGRRVLPFSKGINISGMDTFLSDNQYGFFESGKKLLTDESTYTNIKAQGFDYVRMAINFNTIYYEASDYNYTTEGLMKEVDKAIEYAFRHDLQVMLDFHGWFYIGSEQDDAEQFLYCWEQIANRYKDYDHRLVFELLNEPWYTDGKAQKYLPDDKLYEMQADAIEIIRNTGSNNTDRLIVCFTADGNKAYKLSGLTLPDDDNLAVAIHEYGPHNFTHQNFSWAGLGNKTISLADAGGLGGVNWDFGEIKKFTAKTGIPVILNEFGVNLDKATDADINTYLGGVTKLCRENRMPWAYWTYYGDYNSEGSMSLYRKTSYFGSQTWDETALKALFPAKAAAQ